MIKLYIALFLLILSFAAFLIGRMFRKEAFVAGNHLDYSQTLVIYSDIFYSIGSIILLISICALIQIVLTSVCPDLVGAFFILVLIRNERGCPHRQIQSLLQWGFLVLGEKFY